MKSKIVENDYIFSILNKFISLFASFITIALINRYLGPALKGEYTYIMNIANFLAIVLNLGIYQSYPKSYKDNIPDVKSKYCSLIFLQCVIYVIGAVMIGIGTKNWLLLISSLIVPSQVLANQLSMIMIVEEIRFRQIVQIIAQFVRVGFVAGASLLLPKYVLTVLIIYLLANYYICFAYIIRLKASINLKTIDKQFVLYLFSFGLFSTAAEVLLIINYKADIFMLKYYVDYYQIGLYSVGAGIAECIWLLPDAFKEVLFSRTSRSNAINEVNFAIRVNLFVSVILIIGIFILGKSVIIIYGGEKYIEALTVTRIILLGVPSMALFKITNPLYLANGKQKLYCAILTVSAVTNIIMNLILIPILGINGAAIASVSAFTICGMAFVFYYAKNYKVKISDLIFLKKRDILILKEMIGSK